MASLDFKEVVLIYKQKNGNFKFDFAAMEGNIYKTLRDLGYRRAKVNNRYIYYWRTKVELKITNLADIRNSFISYLKECNKETLPTGVSKEEVINAFYRQWPIKENNLLKDYLTEVLASQ